MHGPSPLSPANPPAAWGLDPVWDTYVKMSASLLHQAVDKALAPRQRTDRSNFCPEVLLFGAGRVVNRVRALGYVVSVKDNSSAREFMLDDGTGLLSCIIFRNESMDACLLPFLSTDSAMLGQLIHVGGPVDFYAGKPQLKVFFASVEHDVNGEVLFWLEVMEIHSTVLSVPFNPLIELSVSSM